MSSSVNFISVNYMFSLSLFPRKLASRTNNLYLSELKVKFAIWLHWKRFGVGESTRVWLHKFFKACRINEHRLHFPKLFYEFLRKIYVSTFKCSWFFAIHYFLFLMVGYTTSYFLSHLNFIANTNLEVSSKSAIQ